MWCEPGNPYWEQDDKLVTFLFVHGVNDCIEFFHVGWVVTVSPIGHEIFL